jgi:hypothetical protein
MLQITTSGLWPSLDVSLRTMIPLSTAPKSNTHELDCYMWSSEAQYLSETFPVQRPQPCPLLSLEDINNWAVSYNIWRNPMIQHFLKQAISLAHLSLFKESDNGSVIWHQIWSATHSFKHHAVHLHDSFCCGRAPREEYCRGQHQDIQPNSAHSLEHVCCITRPVDITEARN